MNKIYTILSMCVTVALVSCKPSAVKSDVNGIVNEDFQKIYPFALRGELNTVFELLDTINVNRLTQKEQEIHNNYYQRFIKQDELLNFETNDSLVVAFVKEFQSYWKSVMLQDVQVGIADSLFKIKATNIIAKHFDSTKVQKKDISEELYKYSNEFLKERDFYSNAFGKTGHLYDLFLWKKEDVQIYPIQLIDDSVKVTVHFMKDFIATGWTHYATFGRNYASGWANKEALYAVDEAYDKNTENFKVSYLTHEGQHFSDYMEFPKLQQTDLEYRAKLVELVKSDATTHKIIGKFIYNAKEEKGSAHGYANYAVIRDLSKLIFNENFVTNKEKWMSIGTKRIKMNSEKLFKQHTSKLIEIGSDTVTELITL